MDKLSELIQEAKPLYKRNKRIKLCVMSAMMLVIPCFAFNGLYGLYSSGNDIYLSLNNNELQNELMLDSMKLLR